MDLTYATVLFLISDSILWPLPDVTRTNLTMDQSPLHLTNVCGEVPCNRVTLFLFITCSTYPHLKQHRSQRYYFSIHSYLHISILYQALPYYSLNTPPPLHCPPSPNHVRKCEHFDVNVVTILRSVKGTIIIQL